MHKPVRPEWWRQAHRRSAIAAALGNTFEYYDYFVFTTAASLIIGPLFFPSKSGTASLIAALGSFAAGFLTRPVGGLVFGHIGDRFGRKVVMIWTLALMGFGTFSIGILPVYAQIGTSASIALLLLRLMQGFAAGGEWGSAVLMTTENAPVARRGLWGACSQAGTGIGFVLAAGAYFLVQQLPRSDFLAWGWRLPFLASALIFALGIYIRQRIPESEEFAQAARRNGTRTHPIRDLVCNNPRDIVTGAAIKIAEMGGSYMMTAFALAYGTITHVHEGILLGAVVTSLIVDVGMMMFFGWLSDRIGRRRIFMFGLVGLTAVAYPLFDALSRGDTLVIVATLVIGNGVFHAAMVGVEPAILTELFPIGLRSSGLAFAQAVSAVLAGFLPMIGAGLYAAYRSPLPLAVLVWCLCAISALALSSTALWPHRRPAVAE